MDRRRFLAVAGSVAAAGCVGANLRNSADEDASRPEGSLRHEEDDPDAEPSTVTEAAELEVMSTASGTVDAGFQLQLYDDLRTVYDRTRELEFGERAYLSGRLAENTDYLFDLSVDGELLVERPVYAGERVVLEIDDRRTIRLTERTFL